MNDFQWIAALPETLSTKHLTPFVSGLLEDVLIPLNSTMPVEAINLSLVARLAQVTNLKRLCLNLEGDDILVNFYGIMFLPSGMGKDKILADIDKTIMQPYHKHFAVLAANYQREQRVLIEAAADEKYSASKQRQQQYIEEHQPRYLVAEGADGTIEGWLAMREAFADAGFGGTFFQSSEFNDFILKDDTVRAAFLTFLKEVYEGQTKAKIIKKDKHVKPVTGIPHSMLAHSPLSGLLDKRGHEKLLLFLNTGLSRRAFISFQSDSTELAQGTADEYLAKERENVRNARAAAPVYSEHVETVIRALNNNGAMTIAENALELYYKYKYFCNQRASKMSALEQEGLRAEVLTRNWKVLKLAAIIAAFEHPDGWEVTTDDVTAAILQAEIYAKSTERLYHFAAPDSIKKVFTLLKEKNGEWVKRITLIEEGYIDKNQYKKWWDEHGNILAEMCENAGFTLVCEKYGKRGLRYRLKPVELQDIDVNSVSLEDLIKIYEK